MSDWKIVRGSLGALQTLGKRINAKRDSMDGVAPFSRAAQVRRIGGTASQR